MYNIEVHNRINQIVEILHRFGLWRNEDDECSTFRRTGWKLTYLIFLLSFSLSLILGGLLSDDKNEFVFLIAAGTANLVVAFKLAQILWKKEEIRAFMLDVGTHSIADHEEFIKVNEKVEILMKFSLIFCLGVCVGCGSINIYYLPVFTSEKTLPLKIWFPLDWRNNVIAYWIAYAFVSTGIISCGTVAMFLDVIIWYLMMNCGIKYQILGSQFRNMGSAKQTTKKKKITELEKENIFLVELIGLIKTHQHIQETTCRFRYCFANLFFTQITTSGICICGSVYVLAFGVERENLIQAAINVLVLFYNIFDIFMVMYFGNEIKLSSDRLSYCLFESNWVEQSKSCRKCIIILTEFLQQPHELFIGKLYPLNLETFTSILDLAYSMFNILQNLH